MFDFLKKDEKKDIKKELRDSYIRALGNVMRTLDGKLVLTTLLNRGNLYKPIVNSYDDNDIIYRLAIHDFVNKLSIEMMEADIETYCKFLKQTIYEIGETK